MDFLDDAEDAGVTHEKMRVLSQRVYNNLTEQNTLADCWNQDESQWNEFLPQEFGLTDESVSENESIVEGI